MTVMCRLVDAEGIPLGDPMYIPQQAGPVQLTELANRFLNNVRFVFGILSTFKIVLLFHGIWVSFIFSRRRSCPTLSMYQARNSVCP